MVGILNASKTKEIGMNLYEAIDFLFEEIGNEVRIVDGDTMCDMVIFSVILPSSDTVFLWVKYSDLPAPVPFSIFDNMRGYTFIEN